MGESKIEWTDATWNPVRGCSLVSAGCQSCYAMKQAHRHSGPGRPYEGLTRKAQHGPVWTGEVRPIWEKMREPLRWRTPRMVFVNSMSDLFHEKITNDVIDQVWATMAICALHDGPQHTFQILTKRPGRMREYVMGINPECIARAGAQCMEDGDWWYDTLAFHLPKVLPNVWLGVSVEDQTTADERIPLLLNTPAAVRFVSYEPALGPVELPWVWPVCNAASQEQHNAECMGGFACDEVGLDWVIVGGESGPGARPFDVAWARSVVEQCKAAGVACFYKQGGASNRCEHDRKGGCQECMPEDLRIREFPNASA